MVMGSIEDMGAMVVIGPIGVRGVTGDAGEAADMGDMGEPSCEGVCKGEIIPGAYGGN